MTLVDDHGITDGGIPYRRVGHGSRAVVVIDGLNLDSGPASSFVARSLRLPNDEYTTWIVGRRRGMPPGYRLSDMADDAAGFIRDHLATPVDLIGGSIAMVLAADHGALVRRLVLHSAAHQLSDYGRQVQWRAAELARQEQWGDVYRVLLECVLPRHRAMRLFRRPRVRVGSTLAGWLEHPHDASDFVITVEAEDQLRFRERLGEIAAPTLVIAGQADPLYSDDLFRETARGIPGAHLQLYPRLGHPALGPDVRRDLRAFLETPLPATAITDASSYAS